MSFPWCSYYLEQIQNHQTNPNHTKFQSNRSSSFGAYSMQKNEQTNNQILPLYNISVDYFQRSWYVLYTSLKYKKKYSWVY